MEKLKIDFDQVWLNQLERIRKRIGMYIGSHNLEDLFLYESGYFDALNQFASDVKGDFTFDWFEVWVKEKLGYKYQNSMGSTRLICNEVGDEENKTIDLFYELLDEYKIKRWGNYLCLAKLDETNQAKSEWRYTFKKDEKGNEVKYIYPIPEVIKLFYSPSLFSTAVVTLDSENGESDGSFYDSLEDALKWAENILGVRQDQWEFELDSYPTWQRSQILDAIRQSDDFDLYTQGIIALVNMESDDQFVENLLLTHIKQHTNPEIVRIVLYGLMRRTTPSERKWVEPDIAISTLSQIPDTSSKVILRLKEELLENIRSQLSN